MNKPWISDELLFAQFLYLEHTLGQESDHVIYHHHFLILVTLGW